MAEQYDGFISYSHAADDLLAPRLQAGLQRFAKPWWKRRALRVFRDESSLSANPHLWSSITDALDDSEWFVLLLSEDAAQSEWVNREVEYWLEHKPADRILPVVTDGEFGWEDGDVSVSSTAAPPALSGVFVEEPRWVDLRWARTDEHLDLSNPQFSDAVADVASAIRGVPKDELASEEVRQHRRTIRTAWAAGVIVLLLGVAATVGAIVAVGQSNEAQTQRDEAQRLAELESELRSEAEANEQRALEAEAEARQLAEDEAEARAEADEEADRADAEADRAIQSEADATRQAQLARSGELAANALAVLDSDPELAVLLSVEAASVEPQSSAMNGLHEALQRHRTTAQVRLSSDGAGVVGSMSRDGSLLVVAEVFGSGIEVWQVGGAEPLWQIDSVYPGWRVATASFTSDDSQIVVQLTPATDQWPDGGPDGLLVYDALTGEAGGEFPIPDCSVVGFPFVRPQYYDFSSPMAWGTIPNCADHGEIAEYGVLDPLTGIFTSYASGLDSGVWGIPTMSADGRYLAVGMGGEGLVFDVATGEQVFDFVGGIASLSRNGSRLLARSDWTDEPLEMWDVLAGRLLWSFQETFSRAWFSEDETLVYGASFDGSTYVLDAATGRELLKLAGHTGRVVELSMSSDAQRLATFAADGAVRVWDIGTTLRSEGRTYATNTRPLHHQKESADAAGGVVAVWGWDFGDFEWETVVFDLATGSRRVVVPGGAPALSPDGTTLALWPDLGPVSEESPAVHRLGAVALFDASTGDLNRVLDGMCDHFFDGRELRIDPECGSGIGGFVKALEYSRDAQYVAAVLDFGAPPGTVALWEANSGALLVKREYDDLSTQTAELSPDSSTLAVVRASLSSIDLAVYAVPSLDVVTELELETGFIAMEFDPTGTLLAGGDDRGNLVLIDATTWTESRSVFAHQGGGIRDVAVSPSSQLIATTGDDSFVRVWRADDLSLVAELELTATSMRNVEFLDEDHLLVTPRFEPVGIVITLDANELIDVAVNRLTRSFTDSECATYGISPCPTLEEIRSRG